MARNRNEGGGLDGILVLAKPTGPTSHDVVALVRRLTATKRVGHGGTLDPFASGVLPIFLGQATRVVEYHLSDTKAYRATVCFGASSTTDDLEGDLTPADAAPTREAVEAALPALRGRITQTPPAYSAVKVGGRRAYALARAGQSVELRPRDVEIHRFEIVDWDDSDPERPIAIVEVECSAGTYIRALARDLGAAVGSAAYLGALVRTASGPFRLEDAVSLDAIRDAAGQGSRPLARLLRPVDAGLDVLPVVILAPDDVSGFLRGQHVRPRRGTGDAKDGDVVRVHDGRARLLGIARLTGGRIAPDKVLAAPDGPSGAVRAPAGARVAASDGRPAGATDHGDGVAGLPVPALEPDVVRGVLELRPEHGPLFAVVGVFDGLHRGHRYLLDELVRHARRLGARPAVITFDSHPDEVLVGAAPPLLLDPDERLRMLAQAGVEVIVVQPFDDAVRQTPYDTFVGWITERTSLAGLLMTPDAGFGYRRLGTPGAVAELARAAVPPWEVVVVPPFTLDGDGAVSSSEIRRAVEAGDLARAEKLLGRPFAVVGRADPDDPARVTFSLPVALPPAGRYPVRVEAADDVTDTRSGSPPLATAVAVLSEGDVGLVIEGLQTLPERVRLTFQADRPRDLG